MSLRRFLWSEGRFHWIFVAAVVVGTILLLWADHYWRTHDTAFLRFW